jgi:cell division protein FtsB
MKKLFSLLVLCFSFSGVFAQGSPVFDLSSLLQAIDQFYATYDHISATIEQVQNTYKQLQQQIEMVKSINFDDIDLSMSSGGFLNLPDIRDPINAVTNRINYNMNLLNDVRDTLFKKKITFGGKSYTMMGTVAQLYNTKGLGLVSDVVSYAKQQFNEAAKGYAKNTTYKEREALWRKYGLSPENYFVAEAAGDALNEAVVDLFTTTSHETIEKLMEDAATQQLIITQMMGDADESVVGNLQTVTYGLSAVDSSINNLHQMMAAQMRADVNRKLKEDIEAEAAKEQKKTEAWQRREEERSRLHSFEDWY